MFIYLGLAHLLSESSEEDPMPHHEELDNFSVLLREYLTIHYQYEKLSKEIIEQLRWFQESMITTSESNVRLSDKKESVLHVEIRRALARLHCYRLLRKGGKTGLSKIYFNISQMKKNLILKLFLHYLEYVAGAAASHTNGH